MEQKIITADKGYQEFEKWFSENKCQCVLVVCDDSIRFMKTFSKCLQKLEDKGLKIVFFRDFKSNPQYESVLSGVNVFRKECCEGIIAVGGGSAIDIAKCIKLYSSMNGCGENGSYLNRKIIPNDIPFIAMPTTAGTGSEATRYAVIYYRGEKQSVTSESCIPQTVLMDANALKTLPLYQRKSTMMDAFCHAMESFWSVNSTDESREYSCEAIRMILMNMDGYLNNSEKGNSEMLRAANIAGKAINITQTTAGHAMCYKLTSLFDIAHGHAAILCVRKLFPWMIENLNKCIDPRGQEYLKQIFSQIAIAMDCGSPKGAAWRVDCIFRKLELSVPSADEKQYNILKSSVNPTRLKNNPIALNTEDIDILYHRILKGEPNEGRKTC